MNVDEPMHDDVREMIDAISRPAVVHRPTAPGPHYTVKIEDASDTWWWGVTNRYQRTGPGVRFAKLNPHESHHVPKAGYRSWGMAITSCPGGIHHHHLLTQVEYREPAHHSSAALVAHDFYHDCGEDVWEEVDIWLGHHPKPAPWRVPERP